MLYVVSWIDSRSKDQWYNCYSQESATTLAYYLLGNGARNVMIHKGLNNSDSKAELILDLSHYV